MSEYSTDLQAVLALLEKATPGPWLYRAKSNTWHRPPPEGTDYSFGESIMDADEDYPTFKYEDIDAITACMNFLRKHGGALSRSEVPAGMVEFVRDVAAQKPERPDYWNSCGQCERNSDRAQELLDSTTPPAQGEQAEVRREDQ